MDTAQEIAKFQALFQLAVMRNIDLTREIQYQLHVLNSLGVEINNEIHNRDRRKSISLGQAEWALLSVRQAAGITGVPIRKLSSISYEERILTREEAAAAYARASGR